MSQLQPYNEPLNFIMQHTSFEQPAMRHYFKNCIVELWQYELFKPILDLVATKCKEKLLSFKVSDRRFFELDEGNCKTIVGTADRFLNMFKAQKRFEISIKKIVTDVIIHEIMHMVEKALSINIADDFTRTIVYEIKHVRSASLKAAINQIMVQELEHYPKDQVPSELFARIYQIFALCHEIKGHSDQYSVTIAQLEQNFPNTIIWLEKNVHGVIIQYTDATIRRQSTQYVKPFSEIKHEWSGKRIQSFHKHAAHNNKQKPQWTASTKSIKDDPFN